jgi:hypothetical protein
MRLGSNISRTDDRSAPWCERLELIAETPEERARLGKILDHIRSGGSLYVACGREDGTLVLDFERRCVPVDFPGA